MTDTLHTDQPRGGERAGIQRRAGDIAASQAPLRAVFMGTPDFAAVILKRLLGAPFISVAGVFTQPDRPAGRGHKLTPPPVKSIALAHGLPVFQPEHFRTDEAGDEALAALTALAPDVLLVAAYGLILPQRVLDAPRLMPINVHASLLPRWRGAAPIQRALMSGEAVTGVTIMRMEAGLDTGPILMQRAVGIDINDTSADLHDELAREGAELLVQALERASAGGLAPIPQDEAKATYAPKLRKEEGKIDLSMPARAVHAHIRGLTPWPGARLVLAREGRENADIGVLPGVFPLTPAMKAAAREYAAASEAAAEESAAGSGLTLAGRFPLIGLVDGALLAACGDGAYAFTRLRPAGGKELSAEAFANGYLQDGGFFS